MAEVTDLVLGVLWHDIGKFKQRARLPEDQGGDHVSIGVDWLRRYYGDCLVTALVATHHGSSVETWKSNFALIGYEADNCAASERAQFDPETDAAKAWSSGLPMASIFGRVRDPRPPGGSGALPSASPKFLA
jgi:CRISPR-associated protein Csm1